MRSPLATWTEVAVSNESNTLLSTITPASTTLWWYAINASISPWSGSVVGPSASWLPMIRSMYFTVNSSLVGSSGPQGHHKDDERRDRTSTRREEILSDQRCRPSSGGDPVIVMALCRLVSLPGFLRRHRSDTAHHAASRRPAGTTWDPRPEPR